MNLIALAAGAAIVAAVPPLRTRAVAATGQAVSGTGRIAGALLAGAVSVAGAALEGVSDVADAVVHGPKPADD